MLYSEQIERLIDLALADGVLSDKEKQVLFRKAEEEGIDLDEFEMVLNAKLFEKKQAIKQDSDSHANEGNDDQIEDSIEEGTSWFSRIKYFVLFSLIGWAICHFGSWHVVWDKKISLFQQYLATGRLNPKQEGILFDSSAILVRFNDAYYGVFKNTHFFDAPVIQWGMLIVALCLFEEAIRALFGGFFGD